MRPDPLNELEEFYDHCRTAPAPMLEIPPRKVWLGNLRLSLAGIGTGVAFAIALVLMVPAPDASTGRKDAKSIANMQMAGVETAPAAKPRASRQGPTNA